MIYVDVDANDAFDPNDDDYQYTGGVVVTLNGTSVT